MTLPNKLGLNDDVELARAEERISKAKACQMFSNGMLDSLPAGSWESLVAIHRYLFSPKFPEDYNYAEPGTGISRAFRI